MESLWIVRTTTLDGPFLWAAEYHDGYTYLSCITTGLYIVQLDIDAPYGIPLET